MFSLLHLAYPDYCKKYICSLVNRKKSINMTLEGDFLDILRTPGMGPLIYQSSKEDKSDPAMDG